MNRKVLDIYRQIAESCGLCMDGTSGAVHGSSGDYQVFITPSMAGANTYPYTLTISASVSSQTHMLSKEELKQYRKEHKNVTVMKQEGHLITLILKNCKKQDRLIGMVREELQAFTFWLRQNGYANCCQLCGRPDETAAYCISGTYSLICDSCAQTVSQNTVLARQQEHAKSENVIGGLAGALLGSLLGVLSIIILSQLGYVAALSGVLMAVCTLKGYELLGKKLSKKGIVLCCVLMAVMTYVGDRLDWAIIIAREFAVDIALAYRSVPMLLEEEVLVSSTYWGNLALVYVFVLLGAVPTILNIMKNRKNEGKIFRLTESSK